MRIGIYIGNYSPFDGGAYSLLETIKKEIVSNSILRHEIFIFFHDMSLGEKNIKNHITYINLYNNNKPSFSFRLKRKVLRLLGKYTDEFSTDYIFHSHKIDLLWILSPHDIEVSIPYVFTVWDLGHRMLPFFPEVSTANGNDWEGRENLYQKMLYRATYIITGNKTGKQEILSNYPVNSEKIKVIPFPVPNFCYEDIESINSDSTLNLPFIFYPAQFWPHKNHISLVETIAWLRDVKNVVIYCYFVGSDKGNLKYIKDTINSYRLENQVFILGFVEQKKLLYLYKNALAMTYVSFMGPNNLPPFEAIALGCPLIYSNIPGHIEQMEGTGIPVNATNPSEIGEAILSIYKNIELRNKLISDELNFIEKYRNYSYFSEMLKIVDSFALYRKAWEA